MVQFKYNKNLFLKGTKKMDTITYVFNNHGDAIAIHIIGGSHTQSYLQDLSTYDGLPVRDYRRDAEKVDYYPQ